MRKLILMAIICASLSLPLCTFVVVRATTHVGSIYDVQLGMDMADVLAGLQGKYSIERTGAQKDLRHYVLTGGPDRRFYYEIFAYNGKVAAVWTDDAKSYSGDTFIVGTELFDALYAAGKPRRDNIGDVLGVRDLNLSVQLQKPASDSSSRMLIFALPGEDFKFEFLNASTGPPVLSVQRGRSLDEEGFHKLSESPSSSVK
jgi:hypothetical protein